MPPPRSSGAPRIAARGPARRRASWLLKLIYCLALVTPLVPAALFGASGWMALYTGGGLLGRLGIGGLVVALLLVLARVVFVMVRRGALQAYVTVRLFRVLAIAAMTVGSISALGLFFVKPIALAVFGTPGDAGIAFFVTGVTLYTGAGLASLGVVVFELTRATGELRAAFVRAVAGSGAPGRGASILRWTRLTVAAVTALAVAAAWLVVSGERRAFEAQCRTVPPPRVEQAMATPIKSILVRHDGATAALPRGWRIGTDEIVLSGVVSFVESCSGSYCQRITRGSKDSPSYNGHEQIKSTVSPVELGWTWTPRRSRLGVTTYEVEYRIRELSDARTIASATELVFVWGHLGFFRSLLGGGEPVEACGYALPRPVKFRSGGYRDESYDAYAKADVAFVKSALAVKP
ncbi:MAG: hypothetical protein DMD87_08430 [Candidatus Rokuibacteriota bacterium]|nr:MAG: hypothetical protein DMD87_08430 [Candidatus Rokubacteria bacterium]